MSFLGELADQINNQFSVGENSTNTLDAVIDGKNVKYGSLGDFAKKIDQSAQRRYLEEGYLRRDPYNADPKQFEVLLQEPNATVLFKKRMFSSIAENFRPDFMDKDEKLYYKAIKVLFQNKCRSIAALEKLSKIQRITSAVGSVSEQLLPIITTLSDTISTKGLPSSSGVASSSSGFGSNIDAQKLTSVMDKVRRIYAFNNSNPVTTWITDDSNLFQTQFGQGTGVIEITNFTNLSTNISVDGIKNPGSFSLSIVDPYEAMLITEWDIEKAISDASNLFYNHSSFQFGKESIEEVINNTKFRLNRLRAARGASPISIKVNPETLLGKRVIAIFDRLGVEIAFSYDGGFGGLGSDVKVSEDYLEGGEIAGFDGLATTTGIGLGTDGNIKQAIPDNELDVFKNLITSIYNKIQLDANSRNAFQVTNKNTNYARRKLRFNFGGKLIIQPMDIVHIYADTKSRYDIKLLSGLKNMFTGVGLLQNVEKTVTDLKNATTSLFNPSGNVSFQAEKSSFVGPEFPNYLWSMLRNQFVAEKEGTHIFAGVVESATDNWSDGKFSIDIQGRDNTAYFDQGKINFKPGVDVFNGAIFDPLTPFKSNFDSISSNAKDDSPQLLDENVAILGTSVDKKGLLKAKAGPQAGQKITSDGFIQNVTVDNNTRISNKIFYAPDGLVYKWKEGIGVFVQFGNSLELNNANNVGNPSIAKEPFAGQDVMNVLSLLITGQPYNYANYWRASQNIDGFGKDPQTQQDAAYSYTASLKNDLIKNNALWGNFVPFKNLVINEQAFALAMQSQFRVIQKNKDLDAKLQKLTDLNRQASIFGAVNALSESASRNFNPEFQRIKAQSVNLQKDIQDTIDKIKKEDEALGYLSNSAGLDATFDFTEFVDSSKIGTSPSNPNIRRTLRKQLNYLTRRISYNVRANQDKNLFIVDDFYDKDYDILAYEKSLTDGIKLYNNEFTSVREKIMNTADLLNLEVFADTQGHIRVRPPQYNRVPSSVFYRMMYLKKAYGVQIFPQFLEDFFGDQIETLRKRVEILEDLIRLDCAILNYNDDKSAIKFILSSNANSTSGAPFSFISDDTGSITDIGQLIGSTEDDNSLQQAQDFVSGIENQASSIKSVFTNSQKYSVIISALTAQNQNADGFSIQNVSQFETNTYVDKLISRIQTKSGQIINKQDYITNRSDGTREVLLSDTSVIDIFKITKELQEKLFERQKVVRLFYSSIKNALEFNSLDEEDANTGNKLIAPNIFGNSHVPEVYEHMIEDETYDDYGLGSGSRFIIKNTQIKNIRIAENPPDFTMVEVQGVLNPFAPNALPEGLNGAFPENGNGLVTAVAIDYDAWRNYGFKNQSAIRVPFLSDPNSQCAPYASMILSRNRKNILRGSITITGNEFMQPGEVIFLEHRQLLFYVTAVRHNFNFGSSFTTTLDISYGHTPGEYIPTTLDIIGKMIYNNRDVAGYAIQRQASSGNDSNLGVVQMDPNASTIVSSTNSNSNSFTAFNSQTLNNILYTAAYTVNANNTKGNNVLANVELRLYHDGSAPVNSNLTTFATNVKNILTGKTDDTTDKIVNQVFPEASVKIVNVNIDDINDRKSPSQKAIDAARNQANSASIPISSTLGEATIANTDKIRAVLFGYIVDCWLSFEYVVV